MSRREKIRNRRVKLGIFFLFRGKMLPVYFSSQFRFICVNKEPTDQGKMEFAIEKQLEGLNLRNKIRAKSSYIFHLFTLMKNYFSDFLILNS